MKIKKIITFAMAFTIIASTAVILPENQHHSINLGMTVSAETETITENGVTYTIQTDDTATITGYTEDLPENVAIPSQIDGHEVKSIWYFGGCKTLKKVSLPDTIESIGEGAFYNCISLEEFIVPEEVTKLEKNTFAGCKSLQKITLNNNIVKVGDYCFDSCKILETVSLPSSVTSLGSGAFMNCEALTQINLPEGLETIGSSCFDYCYSLDNIVIPDSIKELDFNVFSNCTSLTNLDLGNGLETIGFCAVTGCTSLKNVIIPDSVTTIISAAFQNCKSLNDVIIPKSVENFDATAFSGCNLNSITILNKNLPYQTYFSSGYSDYYYLYSDSVIYKYIKNSKSLLKVRLIDIEPGDINKSKTIDNNDLNRLKCYIIPKYSLSLTDDEKYYGDANFDGKLNALDIAAIKGKMLSQE